MITFGEKPNPITTPGPKTNTFSFGGIVSRVGWCVLKIEKKFQGNPMEANGKNQNQCVITFGFGERSWVFPKKQLGLSPLGHSLGPHE